MSFIRGSWSYIKINVNIKVNLETICCENIARAGSMRRTEITKKGYLPSQGCSSYV